MKQRLKKIVLLAVVIVLTVSSVQQIVKGIREAVAYYDRHDKYVTVEGEVRNVYRFGLGYTASISYDYKGGHSTYLEKRIGFAPKEGDIVKLQVDSFYTARVRPSSNGILRILFGMLILAAMASFVYGYKNHKYKEISINISPRAKKVARLANVIIKDRKKIYKISLIVLVVLAITTCISLLMWQHDKNEGDRINAKYGITVTPKVVTSTRIIFQVECNGVKNDDSVHIDDTPFIIEKPTIFGWREVWGPGYQDGFDWAVLHSLYDGASYEFGINWEEEYGKLRRGTYRIGISIEGEGDKRIDWCYFTVKVPKRSEQEKTLSLYEEEKEMEKLRHEATKNYRSWKYIQGFTSIVDEYYVKSNNWETEGVLDWNEERYLSMFHDVKPRFVSNIYTAYYRDFYLKLIDENEVPKEYKDKGVQIYTDMNTELSDICTYVMEEIEGGADKIELVKTDSQLYKDLQKKVTEFGTKYSKKIGDFYKEIEEK